MEDFLEPLREEAIYFKVSARDNSEGGAVSVKEVLNVFKSIYDSYNSYVTANFDMVNTVQDPTRYKKILEGITDESTLLLVDLKFSSCLAAVSPDTQTYLNKTPKSNQYPDIKNPLTWKKEIFKSFKKEVFHSNYNDPSFIKIVTDKYSDVDRNKIFKPIVENIITNKNIKIDFGIGDPTVKHKFTKTNDNTIAALLPKIEPKKDESEILYAFAQVKISNKRTTVVDLFNQEIQGLTIPFDKIITDGHIYELNYKLYCDIKHEANDYIIENDLLGIYVNESTIELAKQAFFEEFDFIYQRYFSLPDESLTKDVIKIKEHLKLLVK